VPIFVKKDAERTIKAIKKGVGKRLVYEQITGNHTRQG